MNQLKYYAKKIFNIKINENQILSSSLPLDISIFEDGKFFPDEVRLIGNYPNPFNPKTEIVFEVIKRLEVRVSIYNVYGQEVWIKNLGRLNKGFHKILWGGKDILGETVVSGIYFYRVSYGDKSLIRKMSLVK